MLGAVDGRPLSVVPIAAMQFFGATGIGRDAGVAVAYRTANEAPELVTQLF